MVARATTAASAAAAGRALVAAAAVRTVPAVVMAATSLFLRGGLLMHMLPLRSAREGGPRGRAAVATGAPARSVADRRRDPRPLLFALEETAVDKTTRCELVMRPLVGEPAAVKNEDPVGAADRGQPMAH
jgi:hypothetical protein